MSAKRDDQLDPSLIAGRALVSETEAAARFGVSSSTIRKWVQRYGLRRIMWDGRSWLLETELVECERARRRDRRGRKREGATRRALAR